MVYNENLYYLLYSCTNPISGINLVPEIQVKILFANLIVGFLVNYISRTNYANSLKFRVDLKFFDWVYYINFQMINQNALLSNQIVRTFDHQYIWKETINVLDFLHRDICKKKIASYSTSISCVWPGIPSDAQTCPNLLGGEFGWSGAGVQLAGDEVGEASPALF